MAGDDDGSQFYGVDAELFGDGLADETSTFLSANKQQLLDNNSRYLHGLDGRITHQWRNVHDYPNNRILGRKFAPIEKGYPFVAWIPPILGLTEITFDLVCKIEHQITAASAEVQFTAKAVDFKSGESWESSSDVTRSGGRQIVTEVLSVDPGLMSNLGLQIMFGWSSVYSEDVDEYTFPSISNYSVDPADSGSQSGVADNINLSSSIENTEKGKMKPYHHAPADVDGVEEVGMPNHVGGWIGDSSADWFVDEESYVVPAALSVDFTRDKARTAGDWTPGASGSMEPQKKVKGRDASRHGENTDDLRRRPKPRGSGPYGTPYNGGYPGDDRYRSGWRWTLTNRNQRSVGDGTGDLIDEQEFELVTENPTIEVYGLLACFWAPAPVLARTGSDGTTKQPVLESGEIEQWAARAGLDLDVSIDRIKDGDTDPTTLQSTTVTLTRNQFWPPVPTSGFTLPNVAFWALYDVERNGNDPDPYFRDPPEIRNTYREGVFQERDQALVTPFRASVDLSTTDADIWRARDVRARVEFNSISNAEKPGGANSKISEKDLLFINLSTNWFEVPQVG